MLRTLVRRAAHQTEQTAAASEPQKHTSQYVQRMIALYPRKKVWPPDFKRLSPEERLGFEKRYKRRMALATASPRWVKFTKMAQLFSIVSVIVYSVLFMEWDGEHQPFQDIRKQFWNALGADYQPAARPVKTQSSLPQARS
ncbi:hypothetical protein N0V82_007162 [Gnomoniopsis sp. IMI 355080]|nr:hypothetical protein N0V82_007162 [Gnomoniopsis sp. IMI 355080]